MNALQGKQSLIAGHAVVIVILLDKAFGANGLLTMVANKAVLMPTVAFVLHLLGAWLVYRSEKNNCKRISNK